MPIKILAIFSAPMGAERLNIRDEKDALITELKNSEYGHLFEITPELHITLPKFKELFKNDFQLIHFSGHSYQNYIIFEKIDGTSEKVPIDAFIKLIKKKIQSPDNQLKCMIFNSCNSFKLGEELSKLGICTISMKDKIKETAARLFTKGFYSEFSNESTIFNMFENAQNNIHLHNLRDWKIPELKGNGNLKFEVIGIPNIPPELKPCIEDERNPDFARVNEVYINPKRFENALEKLTRNKFLIITGPPNVGKTSTAFKLANTIKQDNKEISLIFSIRKEPIKYLRQLKNSIIIFDDVFGKVKFTNEIQANEFSEYQKLTKFKNYLIYTTREEVLSIAKNSRSEFGEFPDLDDHIFRIEPEGSYDDNTLEQILDNHLNYYFKQDYISKNEIEIAEKNKFLIIEKLRFPHNYKELVEIELSKVSKNGISIEEAIDKAKHIKRSVYQWFTNMEDKSMKFFIFTLALFQDLNLNDIEFNKIYIKVIELLKKRHSDLNVFRIKTLLENPLISKYIHKKEFYKRQKIAQNPMSSLQFFIYSQSKIL